MPQSTTEEVWPDELWRLWAKSSDEEGRWLSVPQHMIDSAEIAELLWEYWLSPGIKDWLCWETGFNAKYTGKLISWLAGVHDVGKIDPAFIGQLENQRDQLWLVDQVHHSGLRFPPPITSDRIPHSHLSQVLVKEYLMKNAGIRQRHATSYAVIVGAHHGLPCPPGGVENTQLHLNWLEREAPRWRELQTEALGALTARIEADTIINQVEKPLSSPAQMAITAIVIITDWIASNAEVCTLSSSGKSNDPRRAEHALNSIDPTIPWEPQNFQDENRDEIYSRLFDWPADRHPRPMQTAALELAQSSRSPGGLLIIEAPMGQGKTEAALACAEVLAASSGAGGIMFAAPTMVTADGLLQRVLQWARQSMISPDTVTSLFLGHSKAHLNQEFQQLRINEIGQEREGEVVAHEWLSGRKKGILANAVVGTVDQVLFMALQGKHMMLRHLGLAQKVVVIDEVHAYDTYMSQYLQTALHWLGRYQAPVVLLSATLPPSRKNELLAAYQSGLPGVIELHETEDSGDGYPVITYADAETTRTAITDPGGEPQHVALELIADDHESLRDALRPTAEHGGCTAVVCSTVARAQEVYRLAQEMVGEDAELLHSRFIASQRVEKEKQLLQQLGPTSSRRDDSRPNRRIIVATQVIEQSLDVDFDYMITDIAPSDLVLQRIGRLHRHYRPDGERPQWASHPRVALRGFTQFPTDDQPPEFDELLSLIYPEKLLLASTAALHLSETTPRIELPGDIPRIVRQTYETPIVPAQWSERYELAAKNHQEVDEESVRRAETFKLGAPSKPLLSDVYGGFADDVDGGQWGEQRGLAQVRDTDPSLEVLLVRGDADNYQLIRANGEQPAPLFHRGQEIPQAIARQIAASSIRLPRTFSQPWNLEQTIDELENKTDPAWAQSHLLRGQLMLTLNDEMKTTLCGRELHYDFQLGLIDVRPSS